MLEHYQTLFSTLHTNIDHERWSDMPGARAPHKPLLLLAIINVLSRGEITANFIQLNDELAAEFERLWVLSMGQERTGNPVLPFFHLRTDGFWHLVPVQGKEEALAAVQQVSSRYELQGLVQGAKLDEPLYELLVNEATREELRKVLLDTYFAPDIRYKLGDNQERGIIPMATEAIHVEEQLISAFQQFRQDTLFQFGVKVRRKRAEQLRDLLANPEKVNLDTFNKEVWPLEAGTYLRGSDKRWSIFSPKPLSLELMTEHLEKALESGELELHGNYVWGSGTAVYSPQLKDEAQKEAYVRQALTVLNNTKLSPLEKAKQIDAIFGFGRNIATGLVMLFHPTKFAIYNEQSERALKQLGYQASTLETFQENVQRLRGALQAEDFLELDYFLWLLNQGKYSFDAQPRFWWVNQGDTYRAERNGGYLWAPKEGKGGRVFAHHENVARLLAGDIVLHYSQGALRAISQVIEAPIEADRPGELPENMWGTQGYLVRVAYHDLSELVPLESIDQSWRIATAGPFTQQGSVKQGYLFQLSDQFVQQLLSLEPVEPFPLDSEAEIVQGSGLHPQGALAPLSDEFIQGLIARFTRHLPPIFQPSMQVYQEPSWEQINSSIIETRLQLDARTLRRYHVALKTRGFVILSGLSGTGKTWLTEAYASAISAKYLLVPVAPNWTTNEDLLGYFNPMTGHYHDTSFSLFLREAAADYAEARAAKRQSRPYHLALDEMNLARVEYYFARFLSAMEVRARGQEAFIELGPGEHVLLGPNLFFIGTINVDETTHGFADKVYDRAQLIELEASREALLEHLGETSYRDVLIALWDEVHHVAPFSFRVLDEVQAYVRAAEQLGVSWQEALDEQVVQKILPKCKGASPTVGHALEQVVRLTAGDYPLSHAKAEEMLDGFHQHGFASYF